MSFTMQAYGRLAKDPTERTTKTGNPMAVASMAVDCGQEMGTETLWLSVLAFGALAEKLMGHAKGEMVAVSGRVTKGRYTAADGTERESFTMLADSLASARTIRPKPKPAADNPAPRQRHAAQPAPAEPDFDDDIPF